jgi:hypothetical protein
MNWQPIRISELQKNEETKSKDDPKYNRDSNTEFANKVFSKQAIYKCLEHAKAILSHLPSMLNFIEAKKKCFSV